MSVPIVPPRPSRSPAKEPPKIPPRPIRNKNRDISPADRFAPSPLNDGFAKTAAKVTRFSPDQPAAAPESAPNTKIIAESLEPSRPILARMPSEIGDEGAEYEVAEEIQEEYEKELSLPTPTETRTIGDIEIQAPRPSLPTSYSAIKNTTSEAAAALGLTASGSEGATTGTHNDAATLEDEHGIPEIGRRVPMMPYAGDVQAPESAESSRNHSRAATSRGLPPGSYGLHSHGVIFNDKLEKEYYEKHPEVLEKEQQHASYNPRQVDYARSSADLNKLVQDTHSENDEDPTCGPTEDLAHEVQEEYVSRIASPEVTRTQSPEVTRNPHISIVGDGEVHIDHKEPEAAEDTPILAADEVAKEQDHSQTPAIEVESRASSEKARSRPTSRPLSFSKPTEEQPEEEKTYEPLFKDDAFIETAKAEDKEYGDLLHNHNHKFPSKDIWEDAPNSVYHTAEVGSENGDSGEVTETKTIDNFAKKQDEAAKEEADEEDEEDRDAHFRPSTKSDPDAPVNPALAFARKQALLAEKEAEDRDSSLHHTFTPRGVGMQSRSSGPPSPEAFRPKSSARFPSRDVWEDTPDSLMISTTVDGEQQPATLELNSPVVPVEKIEELEALKDVKKEAPSVPVRSAQKPAIPDRSKPKPKPPVPARLAGIGRSVGGKIATLQAGFMSDLNRRLQLGPQAPKKEELTPPVQPELVTKEGEPAPFMKEKAPLSDARKGRARGPQRRAPAPKVIIFKEEEQPEAKSTFGISKIRLFWSIGAEGGLGFEGTVVNPGEKKEDLKEVEHVEVKVPTPAVELADPVVKAFNKAAVKEEVEEKKVQEAPTGAEAKETTKVSIEPQETPVVAKDEDPVAEKTTKVFIVEETKPVDIDEAESTAVASEELEEAKLKEESKVKSVKAKEADEIKLDRETKPPEEDKVTEKKEVTDEVSM